MAFNVSAFKSNGIIYGGARPSLFDISFSAPPAVNLASASLNRVTVTASAASLPAGNIDSIDVPYFGRKIKVAGDRSFADWTITVLNDEDFSVRSMFELWSNSLNQMVANLREPVTDESYKTDITVQQYAKNGEIIRSYQLIGAFPKLIEAINLDWNRTNEIEQFNVTLAYDYWIPFVETSSKSQGLNVYGPQGASQSTNSIE